MAAEYAAAVAVRLVGRRLLVAAISGGKGGSQIEIELKLAPYHLVSFSRVYEMSKGHIFS